MERVRHGLAVLVIAGALAPAAASAYTPEETTRLEALFETAVDAGAGTELEGATVIAEGGFIVHGDAVGHVDMAEWTDEVDQEIDVIWQSFVEGAVDQSKRLGMTVRPLGWALYPTLDKVTCPL